MRHVQVINSVPLLLTTVHNASPFVDELLWIILGSFYEIIGEAMFESIPELASDLDWMLQSGQASRAMLAEALIEAYYVPVYRLGLGILEDSEAASMVTQETFVAALLNIYRYHEKDGVTVWLFRIFFEVCRRFSKRTHIDRGLKLGQVPDLQRTAWGTQMDIAIWRSMSGFSQNTRRIVLLNYLVKLDISEISSVLQISEGTVRAQLKNARREFLLSDFIKNLSGDSGKGQATSAGSEFENMDQKLTQIFEAYYPAPDLTAETRDQEITSVLQRVKLQDARRRKYASLKELLWISASVFLLIGVIWVGNNWLSGEADPQAAPAANLSKIKSTKTPTPNPTPSRVTPQAILPPTQELNPTLIPKDVFYEVQPGDTLELIAANLGVSADELLHFNRMTSSKDIHPGMQLVIPSSFPVQTPSIATPVISEDFTEPATPPVSSNDIYQFIHRRSAKIKTVWVDAEVIHYGPEGYVGPPIISRDQLWLSDTQFLALHGAVGGLPQEVYMRKNENLYTAQPGLANPWFFPVSGTLPGDSSAAKDLNLLFNTLYSTFPYNGSTNLSLIGSDTIAGQRTWQIKMTDSQSKLESVLWADARTGFVLRSQIFGGRDQGTVMDEIIVTAIAYNVNLPQNDLFNPHIPWRGGFARNYRGAPELNSQVSSILQAPVGRDRLPYIPALGPFNPSSSSLTFQYPQTYSSTEALANVSLFADHFYLGKVDYGNPWTMICARSPDGSKIAYVSQPLKSITQDASLYWFNLLDIKSGVKHPLGEIHVTQLAFAPDSSRLAVFGYGDQSSTGRIYILDLQSGQVRPIHAQGDVKSLVWSPDGKYLAFIGRDAPPQYNDEVIVLRVDTGEITFRSSIDLQGNRGSAEWPPLKWGIDFPREMSGFANCSLPPPK